MIVALGLLADLAFVRLALRICQSGHTDLIRVGTRTGDHAILRNPTGLRDATPCIPEAADEIWLYNAVDVTATWLAEGFGSSEFSPRLPRARSTDRQKIVICSDEEGERRDSNPRPPGPQPAPTGTSQALSGALWRSESRSVALACAHNFPRGVPRAYVRIARREAHCRLCAAVSPTASKPIVPGGNWIIRCTIEPSPFSPGSLRRRGPHSSAP
jgi:hypothetical protein